MKGKGIDHVNIRIPDDGVEKALEFYRDLLGFETIKLDRYKAGERTSFFFEISDNALINIRPKDNFVEPSGKNFDHFCLLLDEKPKKIQRILKENNIKIIRESQSLGTTGRAKSIYVKDQFGYKIELKTSR